MLKNKKFKKAFTLIELLIVVIIIGILMTALLPKITGAQAGARDAARKVDVANISTALMRYFDDNGEYPDKKCTDDLSGDLKSYIKIIPTDPQGKRTTYGTKSSGCTDGAYGYSALKNNGAEKGGSVVVANMEQWGKGPNWVLTGSYTGTADFTTGVDEADILSKMCEKVMQSTGSDAKQCDSDTKVGKTKKQNQMVFVVFN